MLWSDLATDRKGMTMERKNGIGRKGEKKSDSVADRKATKAERKFKRGKKK